MDTESKKNLRAYRNEDDHCWWCGKMVITAAGGDPEHSTFCSRDCEDRWKRAIGEIEDRFKEWED